MLILRHISAPEARSQELSFSQEDFVLFGFQVYGGRVPINAEKLFNNIRGSNTPCALVAVYGNRAYDGALLDLHKLAAASGFIPVAGITVITEHALAPQLAASRPDEQDCLKLAAWGRELLNLKTTPMALESVPGAYPNWDMPAGMSPYPITNIEKCTRCGICAEVCPTGAIPLDKPYLTDDAECIFCGACAKYCPEKARVMGNEIFHEFGKPHLLEAAKRKEPEFFYTR